MERLPRAVYLSGYYQRWLAGLELRLVEAGYLGPDEVDARIAGHTAEAGDRRVSALRRKSLRAPCACCFGRSFPTGSSAACFGECWVASHTVAEASALFGG